MVRWYDGMCVGQCSAGGGVVVSLLVTSPLAAALQRAVSLRAIQGVRRALLFGHHHFLPSFYERMEESMGARCVRASHASSMLSCQP